MTKKFTVKEICRCVKTKPHPKELHERKLSGRGPEDAELMIVGMAPGQDEASSGKYFVGAAGTQLKKDLLAAGIVMDDCRIQNVGCYWPPEHNLKKLSKEQREEGEQALIEDIKRVKPKLILAFGTEALEFLTGKTGITHWRTTILDTSGGHPDLPPATVIPTLHPSAILRSWDFHVLYMKDLRKAKAFLRGEDVFPIERKLITKTNCSKEEYQSACLSLIDAAKAGTRMACDIETFRGSLACIAFATSADYSVSVHGEDREIWQTILRANNPKIWHNAMYDVTFLEAMCGTKCEGVIHDTQLMWHALYPELACSKMVGKSLALLVSLYTNDAYYKDERENWRKVADWNAFYEYNARDSACTVEIFDKLNAELDNDDKLRAIYDFEMALLEPYKNASIRGFKIDTISKGRKKAEATKKIKKLTEEMKAMAGEDFNPRSHPQVKKFLKSLGSKETSTDIKAITNILIKSDPDSDLHKFTTLLKDFREVSKAHDTYYNFGYDDDGRVRTNWIIPGTETGRMANSKSIIFKGGVNLMTIPRPARVFFLADTGYKLVYADLSQAEARLVAYLSGCTPMIEAFESGRDLYKSVAAQMFRKDYDDVTYDDRYLAKRCVLGLLYGMGPKTWRLQTNIDMGYDYMSHTRAQELYDLFFVTFPQIRAWHKSVEKDVLRDLSIRTLFGRRRMFRPRNGRLGDHAFREAYDFVPQGTVPDIINTAVLTMERVEGYQLIGQIHDALLCQVKTDEVDKNIPLIVSAMTMPLEITDIRGVKRTCTIPVEVEVGDNWGEFSEDNPNGLVAYVAS